MKLIYNCRGGGGGVPWEITVTTLNIMYISVE